MKARGLLWLLGLQAAVLALLGTLALDFYAHRKLQGLGGVNVWGYRGPVARAKRPREVRVALVGGTRAFGWGMVASATTAPAIYTRIQLVIDRPGTDPPPLDLVNLGRPGALPADFPPTIRHYAYLQADYICLYDDLGVTDAVPEWSDSGVFALTGYMPILPLVLREKGAVLSRDGRMAGGLLETTGAVLMAVDGVMGNANRRRKSRPATTPVLYAEQLQAAVDVAHQHARGVVVVVGPAELDEQRRSLESLVAVRKRCAANDWCRFVDLGPVEKLRDPSLRLDSWNYGGEATWAVAETITPALLSLMGYH